MSIRLKLPFLKFLMPLSLAIAVTGCAHSEDTPVKEPHAKVTQATVMFPIAEGETPNWIEILADLTGPRYDEYVASRTRFGLTSQITFLQSTPMGDFAVIHMTGDDIDASIGVMSSSDEKWDSEWRTLVSGLHGVDFNDREAIDPGVKPAYEVAVSEEKGSPLAFVVPLKEGISDEAIDGFLKGVDSRKDSLRESRRTLGIHREVVTIQRSPLGVGVLFFWRAENPNEALVNWSSSTDEFDVWMLQELGNLAAIPLPFFFSIAQQNHMVGAFPKE